jgi:hypothetical protein
LFPSLLLVLTLGLFQKRGGLFQDPVVGDETDNVAGLRLLKIPIESGHGKTVIGPKKDPDSRIDFSAS